MIGWFIITMAVLGQTSTVQTASTEGPPRVRIPAVLESEPDMLQRHRTYMALVQARLGGGGLAVSERGYVALLASPEFENLAQAMDGVLAKHPEMSQAVERFNEALDNHPEMQSSLDALKTWRQTHPDEQTGLAALISGVASSDTSLPAAQGPAAAILEKHPELRGLLSTLSNGLGTDAGAREGLQGWWDTLGALRGDQAGAVKAGELLARPNAALARLLMEQAGKAAQAMEPQTQWLQDWHERVRKDPQLGVDYWQYVAYALKHPEEAYRTEQQWKLRFGATPQWPPSDLAASETQDDTAADGTKSTKSGSHLLRPDRPRWPSVTRPTPPIRPRRPTAE